MDRKKESRRGIHYKELLFVAIITLIQTSEWLRDTASIALRLAVGVAQGHIRRQASPEHGRAPRAGVSGRRPSVTPLSVLAIDVTPARGPTTKGRTHGTFHVSFHASAPSFRSFS
ncbi:hypothetical protein SETIT_7G312100v2 [Setaria italica]|uniref:Uncharacterized protein n=1 Tax=Setaria italica TaxID=4555 RepID=A0A368S1Z0_SETIT|nr:hypothetical protein SETIT_7G312100v2 [Setaria italica]